MAKNVRYQYSKNVMCVIQFNKVINDFVQEDGRMFDDEKTIKHNLNNLYDYSNVGMQRLC